MFDDARRYLEAAENAGLRRFVVSSSANTKDVLHVTGLEKFVEGRVDGNTISEKHLKGKPAPDSFLEGAEVAGVDARAGRGVRGRAGRRRRPATPGSSASSSASTGSTTSTARRLEAARRVDRGHLAGPTAVDARTAERYPVEPWELREVGLDLDDLARSESLFALSNGHIGARGTLDEGDPHGLPGTYLNSFFENRPLPYAEAGYGFPEVGQTILNVTDGKIIRLLVDDEPFDLRYGEILHHDRVLDLRTGILSRVVEWAAPSGQVVRVRSQRLVSLTQRSIMAIDWEVEAVGDAARVVVQSELVANEFVPAQSKDPRVASLMEAPLEPIAHDGDGSRAWLLHGTHDEQAAHGRCDGTHRPRTRRSRHRPEGAAGHRALHGRHAARARAAARR